jgi:hypothetical protein
MTASVDTLHSPAQAFPVWEAAKPAYYTRPPVRNLVTPGQSVGTGGLPSVTFISTSRGYHLFRVIQQPKAPEGSPFVPLMKQIRSAFGRTFSSLPEIFGVSRTTLYNWVEGDVPKEIHHPRLVQLAAAAQVFAELQFTPTSSALDRSLLNGKSFLQLLAAGADGAETARKLVRVVQRGAQARADLDALLAGRSVKPEAPGLGAPAWDET